MTDTGDPRHGNGTVRPDPTVLTTQLVDRAISAFREVMETRLGGMDTATELVAERVAQLPSATSAAHDHLRADFDRDLAAVREMVTSLRELIEGRVDGMDKAVELLAENVRQFPSDTDKAIRALQSILMGEIKNVRDVTSEKFEAVNTRFLERDTRTEQAAQESRISLDAALAAAKEAVSEQNKANTQAIAKSETATQKQIDAMVTLMTTSNKSLEDKIGDLKTRVDRGEGTEKGTATSRTERRLDLGQVVAVVATIVAILSVVLYALKK